MNTVVRNQFINKNYPGTDLSHDKIEVGCANF